MNGGEGQVPTEKRCQEDGQYFPQITGYQVENELADIGIDDPSFLYRGHDGGEVVVGEHHVGCLFGDISASDAHGHTYVRSLKCRSVIHSVTCHGYYVPLPSQCLHNAHLVLWRDPGIDVGSTYRSYEFLIAELVNVRSTQHRVAVLDKVDLA